MLRHFVAAAVGYVAGTLPSADLIARGVDVNGQGSGNPGAANVANLVGRRAGAVVFALDMGKALLAARLGARLVAATHPAGSIAAVSAASLGANLGSAGAVLGHCYPAQRNFRGGKGVAASFGQMLATFPAYLPVDLALGVVVAKNDTWKQRPVASISATCGLWVALAALWWRRGLPNLWAGPATPATPIAAAVASAAIVHRFAAEASPDVIETQP